MTTTTDAEHPLRGFLSAIHDHPDYNKHAWRKEGADALKLVLGDLKRGIDAFAPKVKVIEAHVEQLKKGPPADIDPPKLAVGDDVIPALTLVPNSLRHENDGEYYDALLADRVADSYKTELVKRGADWFFYDHQTHLWRADPHKAKVRQLVETRNRIYVDTTKLTEVERRKVLGEPCIRDVVSIVAHKLYDFDNVAFDHDPDIAGLPGGKCVELKTGTIREATREDRLTMTLGVSPKAEDCPRFRDYLKETIPDDANREYVLRWLGYALTGRMESEAFLFIHGLAGTGKSTLSRLMLYLTGDYGTTVAGDNVAGWRETHRQWLARLAGKRFVSVPELPKNGGQWRTTDLNSMITGEPMEANFMRKNSFQFSPVCKLMVIGNDRPKTSSENAIFRRMRLLDFNVKPNPKDPRLFDALKDEAPQILNLLIPYAARWYTDWLDPMPESMREAIDEYREDQVDAVLADVVAAIADTHPEGWTLASIIRQLAPLPIKSRELTKELKRQGWEQWTNRKGGGAQRLWRKKVTTRNP